MCFIFKPKFKLSYMRNNSFFSVFVVSELKLMASHMKGMFWSLIGMFCISDIKHVHVDPLTWFKKNSNTGFSCLLFF